jgi:hypothetical protein
MPLRRFPNDVLEELDWYVYRLIDPATGQTFYVGKGTGNRVFDHIRGQIESTDDDLLSPKIEIIRRILDEGHEVQHVIHRHKMKEDTAFEVEAALIEAYPNLTNIRDGKGNIEHGSMTAEELVELYTLEEATLSHKLIIIDVNRSFNRRERARTIDGRENLLDAVRFRWVLNKKRAQQCDYVLAQRGGVILGVFRPEKWLDATLENFPEFGASFSKLRKGEKRRKRIGFKGYQVSDPTIVSQYEKRRVPAKLRTAPRQPCRYFGI